MEGIGHVCPLWRSQTLLGVGMPLLGDLGGGCPLDGLPDRVWLRRLLLGVGGVRVRPSCRAFMHFSYVCCSRAKLCQVPFESTICLYSIHALNRSALASNFTLC